MLVTEAIRSKATQNVEYGRRFDLDLPGKDGHVVAFEVIGLVGETGAG